MLKRPSVWIGLAVGGFVAASAFASIGFGGLFLGAITGLAAGIISFSLHAVIAASYLLSKNPGGEIAVNQKEGRENLLLAELRFVGLEDDASLIEKLLGDRDAILLRYAEMTDQIDAIHTAELVGAVGELAVRSGEELHDLVRRQQDPHLARPADVEAQIAACRDELRQAYQAIVDTRSRLRKGQFLSKADIVAVGATGTLRSLTEQLQAETQVAELVEKRLQDDELLHGLHRAEREFPEDEAPGRTRE